MATPPRQHFWIMIFLGISACSAFTFGQQKPTSPSATQKTHQPNQPPSTSVEKSTQEKGKQNAPAKQKPEKEKSAPEANVVVKIIDITIDAQSGLEKPNGRIIWSITAPQSQSAPDVKTAEVEIALTTANGESRTIRQTLDPKSGSGAFLSPFPQNSVATNFNATLTLLFTLDNHSFRQSFRQSGTVKQPPPPNSSKEKR